MVATRLSHNGSEAYNVLPWKITEKIILYPQLMAAWDTACCIYMSTVAENIPFYEEPKTLYLFTSADKYIFWNVALYTNFMYYFYYVLLQIVSKLQ